MDVLTQVCVRDRRWGPSTGGIGRVSVASRVDAVGGICCEHSRFRWQRIVVVRGSRALLWHARNSQRSTSCRVSGQSGLLVSRVFEWSGEKCCPVA